MMNTMNNGELNPEMRSSEAGWTFIEIIIVVFIFFILTGAVGFAGIRYVRKARQASTANEIAAFSLALDSYYLDCGMYPSEEQGLEALWAAPVISPVPSGWSGPYLTRKGIEDSWGRDYVYKTPGPEGLPYSITSYGADGLEGGEDLNADIHSWKD